MVVSFLVVGAIRHRTRTLRCTAPGAATAAGAFVRRATRLARIDPATQPGPTTLPLLGRLAAARLPVRLS